MSRFDYNDEEKEINRVLLHNRKKSEGLLSDGETADIRAAADEATKTAEELLESLGYGVQLQEASKAAEQSGKEHSGHHGLKEKTWEELIKEADGTVPEEVVLEDLLDEAEIEAAFKELDAINADFSKKTGIINKTDLSFLAIATALQVAKVLIFPYAAKKFGYGDSFDKSERMAHNDKRIEDAHEEANDKFRDKHIVDKDGKNRSGYWINILYQTPAYDITKGSPSIGVNMEGGYHRVHTLGHDPIMGWIFGTANILTDIITLNNFKSYRIIRKPAMKITPEQVGLFEMFKESYDMIKADSLNLPAAIFAQAQHLKADAYTKVGLPVPFLEAINESFASELYRSKYDALCLARDLKIVGASYAVSLFIDMVIGLVHGLFRQKDEDKKLYEVRTRKILLISESIASCSSIVNACITKNPKNLDIGSLLATITHLFVDVRFMAKIKKEFVKNEIDARLMDEIAEIDKLYDNL